MTDLQAALGLPQLGRYDSIVAARQANADRLRAGLADIRGIVAPSQLDGRRHVWHQFTIRVTPESGITREELSAKLAESGVGSGIYYPKLVFDYDCYRGRDDVIVGEYPVAERIVQEVLSLPVHPGLTEADVDTIVDAVRKAVA
jgi:dTDP-4-amino-4,6-dideoxygalactose transaminase